MLASGLFVALIGATTALASPEIHHLVTRQALTSASIPSSCQSGCTGALDIYNACLSGNTGTCSSVCQTSNFNSFVGCFNCVIQNTPGATSSDYAQLQAAVNQLQSACAAAGQTVSATASLSGLASASTAAQSGSGAIGSGFTSATSGVTIGGSASSVISSVGVSASAVLGSSSIAGGLVTSSAGGGPASSAGGAISSVASVAASSSRSAGQAVALLPQGMLTAGALVVMAIGGGAALVL